MLNLMELYQINFYLSSVFFDEFIDVNCKSKIQSMRASPEISITRKSREKDVKENSIIHNKIVPPQEVES